MKKKYIIIFIILCMCLFIPKNIRATDNNQLTESNQLTQGNQITGGNQNTETNEKTVPFYNSDITWSWDYLEPSGLMPFGLCTPSTADDLEKLPVIVWLHGKDGTSGAKGSGIRTAPNGLPKQLLDEWEKYGLEGFSAYVICPRIFNENGQWSASAVSKLLDYFIKEYNVDKENIVIMGHSLGANSVLLLANRDA